MDSEKGMLDEGGLGEVEKAMQMWCEFLLVSRGDRNLRQRFQMGLITPLPI